MYYQIILNETWHVCTKYVIVQELLNGRVQYTWVMPIIQITVRDIVLVNDGSLMSAA